MAKPTTINVSMPASLAAFVTERMAAKGFGNTSEYFRSLVREDQKRARDEHIEQMLLDGLSSGKPIPVTEAWWEARRQKLAAQLKKRKAG